MQAGLGEEAIPSIDRRSWPGYGGSRWHQFTCQV